MLTKRVKGEQSGSPEGTVAEVPGARGIRMESASTYFGVQTGQLCMDALKQGKRAPYEPMNGCGFEGERGRCGVGGKDEYESGASTCST